MELALQSRWLDRKVGVCFAVGDNGRNNSRVATALLRSRRGFGRRLEAVIRQGLRCRILNSLSKISLDSVRRISYNWVCWGSHEKPTHANTLRYNFCAAPL